MKLYLQKQEKKTISQRNCTKENKTPNNLICFSPSMQHRSVIQLSRNDNLELRILLLKFTKKAIATLEPLVVEYKKGLAKFIELETEWIPEDNLYDELLNEIKLLNNQKAELLGKETNVEFDTQYEQLDSDINDIDNEFYQMLERWEPYEHEYQDQQNKSDQLRPVVFQQPSVLFEPLESDKEYPHTSEQKEEWLTKYHELDNRFPEALELIIACNQSIIARNDICQQFNEFMHTINIRLTEVRQQLETLVNQHVQYITEREQLRAEITKTHDQILHNEDEHQTQLTQIKKQRHQLRDNRASLKKLIESAENRIGSNKDVPANQKRGSQTMRL